MIFIEKIVGTKKKEKSVENKVPSKRKSVTSSASKKLSEEAVVDKNVCNSIENQENRVNCANSKNYNSDNTNSVVVAETGSKETEHCQNGTDRFRIINCMYIMLHKIFLILMLNKHIDSSILS